MRIAGVEPSMGCLKDNCFTIKQYSLLFIHNIYYSFLIKNKKGCGSHGVPHSFGVRPTGRAGLLLIYIYIYIYIKIN